MGISALVLVDVQAPADRAALALRPAPDRNPAAVYLARLAPGSRRTVAGCLRRLAAMLGADVASCSWRALRYQHTAALRARLAGRYSFRTANLHLAALRGVLKEAWRLGLMSAEAYHQAADLEPVRGHRELAGRHVARLELRDLFAATGAGSSTGAGAAAGGAAAGSANAGTDAGGASTSTGAAAAAGGAGADAGAGEGGGAGARDRALLALLAGAGLRRSEAVALCVADYEAASGALRVVGKGNKGRTAYVTHAAKDAIEAWLVVRGSAPGALLCPVRRGGKIELRHMSDAAVRLRCVELAKRAGVRSFSPHDLRRTWVSDLLDAGADLVAVQGLAGHSSPAITAKYDRRAERAKRRAAELVELPWLAPR